MKPTILLLAAASSLAATAASPYFSIIQSVADNDFELKAARTTIEAVQAAGSAENTLDGPEIEFEHLWAPDGTPNKWNIGISQEFAWPGLYKARTEATRADALVASATYQLTLVEKSLKAKQLIIDLINCQKRLDLYKNIGRNLSAISDAVQRSYDLGEATVLDLRKARLAVADNISTIATIAADNSSLTAGLDALNAVVPQNFVFDEYPFQEMQEPRFADNKLANALYDARVIGAKAHSKVVRLQAWPTFSAGYRHAYEELTHFNGLSVSLRLPSFSQNKRRKAAALEAEALQLEADFDAMEGLYDIIGNYYSAKKLKEAMDIYDGLTSDDSYLDLLLKAFEGGELTVLEYLNEINIFTEARLSYLDLQYRYNLDLARLNRYRHLDF